jgi:hypothetical protein
MERCTKCIKFSYGRQLFFNPDRLEGVICKWRMDRLIRYADHNVLWIGDVTRLGMRLHCGLLGARPLGFLSQASRHLFSRQILNCPVLRLRRY